MSGKNNKVAMCCGCSGIGCIGIIIIMVVGGYFGVNFVAGKGRDFAAYALERGMEISLKDAFSTEEKKEIMDKASKLAIDIKDGKVGLVELVKKVSAQISDSTLFAQTIALSFKRNYVKTDENGEKKEDNNLISKFVYGLTTNKVSYQQAKGFLKMVTVQYKEKFDPDSDSSMTHTGKKINYNLSKEQVKSALQYVKTICENIEAPKDFNPSESAKNEYLKIFKSVYEQTTDKKADAEKINIEKPNAEKPDSE